ncbi:P-loop NTPase fold protein [Methanolobus sp. ZRKC3]|uniref:P-loop NTPase fold protein n=1 Tax=Methanolobus sp. ZRKC3 TaxID=3125786 RepID=UPI003245770F
MNEDEQKTHGFKLLTDEITDTDFFEDKTHENVAETLYKLIDDNDNGFTIGLEGSWGSGKSTVVSILKKKIEKKSFHYFYFDAWAHEGDHLRRIFLESLISQVDVESKKLKELSEKISNRKRETITHTKQYGTKLGKWLAGSVLFVPLGAGLVSGVDSSQLFFQLGGNPHLPFLFGVFFSLMPVWVIIGNICYLGNNAWKTENWAFLESEVNNTTTQEISEDEERSSIEFEKYFGEIMSEIFEDDPSSKLMIVVDNLDRIDAQDSLKIWSTLQTFLQQRNPSKPNNQWYKKIWIIVPYDMNGLSKLWGKENILSYDENTSDEKCLGSCAKSFFDKCFQIRIEVPEPVLTGWESFTREMINEACIGWNNDDKNDVLRMLKLTRENLGDIPTPREIKNYINQVGILRLHADKNIPTKSVAYYVVHKYLKGSSTQKIKRELINNELPKVQDNPFLPSECSKHLAGIVFGVGAQKGHQLLLEPEIEKVLQNANGHELKALEEMHESGFWPVFDHHIDKLTPSGILFNYSKAIYSGLWDSHEKQCRKFVKKIEGHLIKKSLSLLPEGCIEDYLPIIKMSSNKIVLQRIWDMVLIELETRIAGNNEFDYEANVKYLENIVEIIGDIHKTHIFSKISSEELTQWALASDSQHVPAYKWILPPQEVENDIVDNIGSSSSIKAGTKELLTYSINAGINSWEKIPLALRNHIFQNNGNQVNENNPSIEALDILVWITSYDESCREEIKELLKTGQYHNFVYHQQKNKSPIYSALLMAYYFKNDLHTISIPAVESSARGLQVMRDVWTNRNEINAKEMYAYIKQFNHFNLLWDLVECNDNKLGVDIINLAFEDETSNLFVCSDVLNKMHFTLELIENENNDMKDKLVTRFMKHSEIKDEIRNSSNLDVSYYSEELFLVLKNTDDEEIINRIVSTLILLEKDEWNIYFEDDTYLANLALEVQNKKPSFWLENAYSDSIFEFAEQWANSDDCTTNWQKSNWIALTNLMGESFQKHYKNKITKLLLENKFVVTPEFYTYNMNLFEYPKLFKEGLYKIQDLLEEAVKDNDLGRLEILDEILSHDENGDFVPEKYISDVISKDLNDLYWTQDDNNMEQKNILKRLAKKFNIEIKEPVFDYEDEES